MAHDARPSGPRNARIIFITFCDVIMSITLSILCEDIFFHEIA